MWKNLPLKEAVYTSFILGGVSIASIIALNAFLPPVVPLLYGLPSGDSQLVPKLGLLITPISALVIVIFNLVLAKFTKDIFFKKTLVIAGTFVSLLATISIVKTILLVGFF